MYKCIILTALFITLAQCCGPVTHSIVAHRALYHATINNMLPADTLSILNNYSNYLTSGSVFPDYLYHCTFDHDTGEVAHWIPFQVAAVEYMHTLQHDTDQYQQLLAFMYGVVSHSISDINWHGINWMVEDIPSGYGFLEILGQHDTNCGQGLCSIAHQLGDFGGDLVGAQNTNITWFNVVQWEIPTQAIVEIFALMNHTVSYVALRACRDVFIGATESFIRLGQNPHTYHKLTDYSSTLVEQYVDMHLGGIDDMSIYTTRSWQRLHDWLQISNGSVPTPLPIGIGQSHTINDDRDQFDPMMHLHTKSNDYWDAWLKYAETAFALSNMEHIQSQHHDSNALQFYHVQSLSDLSPYSYYGHAIVTGDLNGDAHIDRVYSAYGAGVLQTGEVHIHYHSSISDTVQILYGLEPYGKFGYSLAIVDYNVDGINDLVVSAPTTGYNTSDLGNSTYGYYGSVYIYYGNAHQQLNNDPDVVLFSSRNISLQLFGHVLYTADVNGDGHDDLLIGSPYGRSTNHSSSDGYVDIYYSSSDNTYTEFNTPDLYLHGWDNFWLFGSSIQVAQLNEYTRCLLVTAPMYRYWFGDTNGLVEGFNITNITDIFMIEDYKSLFSIINDDPAQYHSQFALSISYSHSLNLLAIGQPAASYIDTTHSLYELFYHSLIALINIIFDIIYDNNIHHSHSGAVHLIDIRKLSGDHLLSSLNGFYNTIQHTVRGSRFGSSVQFVSPTGNSSDDSRLIVTAPLYSPTEHQTQFGAVYVYDNIQLVTGINDAQSTATHTLVGESMNGRFGSTVSHIHSAGTNTLIIGEPYKNIICDDCREGINEMIGEIYTFDIPA